MEKIAENTTATDRVIAAYNKTGYVRLFPCYENTCDEVDMIYIDNGSTELFTMNQHKRNSDRNVVKLENDEMCLESGQLLEFLELENVLA